MPVSSATSRKFQPRTVLRRSTVTCGVTAAAKADFSLPSSRARDGAHVHLVGPVEQPHRAVPAVEPGQQVSSLTPAAPCTWMARSMTLQAICGATALIIGTPAGVLACSGCRAGRSSTPPCDTAGGSGRSRCGTGRSARCTTPCSASGLPNAMRFCTRSTISAIARSATPMRAHAVVDAAGAEPGLGDREAAALLAEQVGRRHPDVVEGDLAVAVLVLPAEHRQRPHDRHTGGVDGHEDHRLLLMAGGVGVGAAHHDQDLAARVGGTVRSTTCGR